jgi:pyruvate dehydrogenase E1 component alpha subunit
MADHATAKEQLGLSLYETLFLVRRSEEAIIQYYAGNEMKTPMHMSMGQEAIAVGVCAALGDAADIFSSYRSHAAFLARTGKVEAFFAELFGRIGGTAEGKAGSMHVADFDAGHLCSTAIVGSGIPVALGVAFANQRLKNGRVAATFFGDGATEEGAFWESLNAACALRLPVLFVCEDNGLAVHTDKAARHGFRSIARVIERFDCLVIEDDSNDVERIRAITREAAERALSERRPAFLIFECYRYLEHVGIDPDFDAGYREKAAYERYLEKDCLAMQRQRLIEYGIEEATIGALEARIEARIESSIEAARRSPLPPPDRLLHGVFHETD